LPEERRIKRRKKSKYRRLSLFAFVAVRFWESSEVVHLKMGELYGLLGPNFRKALLDEVVVTRCVEEGLVSGQRFAVDANLIEADTNRQNSTAKKNGNQTRSNQKMHLVLFVNIWRHWDDEPLLQHPCLAGSFKSIVSHRIFQ
jgi:hypothetical protein